MGLTRNFTRTISRMLIGVVLFAQWAIASYACPGLMGVAPVSNASARTATLATLANLATSADEPVAMPHHCDQMDPGAANLCAEHCHQGQQSADTAAVPAVGLGIPTLLYLLPFEPQRSLGSGRCYPASGARWGAAPEPPHAILHCVFRI